MTTANSFTSTILIEKSKILFFLWFVVIILFSFFLDRNHETTKSEKLPLTTGIDLKFSTNENTKKQEKLEEENIIDDLLFS